MKSPEQGKQLETHPLVSFITVNYNGKHFLRECLDSLAGLNYPKDKQEVIVVDNGSDDGSVAFLKEKYPGVIVLQSGVNNYCHACNLGVKAAHGEFIALINNDVQLEEDWLLELLKGMRQDGLVGVAGGKIRFFDHKIQSAGHEEYPDFYWGDRGFKEEDHGQYEKIEEVGSLCGAAILFRKSCLKDIGPFDEDFVMYLEDVDICLRCRKKQWKVLYVPRSLSRHHFSGTSDAPSVMFFSERNRLLLLAKHFPEKLSGALYGKGFFSRKEDGFGEKNIYDILPLVFSKLLATHSIKTINEITPELFKNVDFIARLEKSILIKQLEESKGAFAAQGSILEKRQRDYAETNAELEKTREELNAKKQALLNASYELETLKYESEMMKYEWEMLKKDWERIANLDKKIKYLIIKPCRVSVGSVEKAIGAIKRKYPQALIHLLANPLTEEREPLSKSVNIDKKIFNPSGKGPFSWITILKLIFSFRLTKYDVAIILEPFAKERDYKGYRKARIMALLSGAKAVCACQIE